MNNVVVDASIAAKWFLTEEDSATARRLLIRWKTAKIRVIAPAWFACEVANIVHRRKMRGQLTVDDAREVLTSVLAEVVLVETPPADAIRALEIAYILAQQTPYDAQYLALAEREGCEYWTDDAKFVRAAAPHFPSVKPLADA